MLEITLSDHGNYSIIDGSLVIESHQHLLLQLGIRNLGADGDSSLDSFLNFLDRICQLGWGVLGRIIGHATGSCVEGRNLENSMSFFNILHVYHSIKMHLGDRLRKSDNGFELSYSNWDSIRLLRDSLVL